MNAFRIGEHFFYEKICDIKEKLYFCHHKKEQSSLFERSGSSVG